MAVSKFVFHVPGSWLKNGVNGLNPFFRNLNAKILGHNGLTEFLIHERALTHYRVSTSNDFHIIDHGSIAHPQILIAGVAYVRPFFNLDPRGIRAFSCIGDQVFSAELVKFYQARKFYRSLRQRVVGQRISLRPQKRQVDDDIPDNCIAVFLQAEADRLVDEVSYLSREEMISALLNVPDMRPIVIKKHPLDQQARTDEFLAELQGLSNRISVSSANIHDILAKASVTVTINSGVGIESMLHRVPVILCGHADFHHCAVTVKSVSQMEQALTDAAQNNFPYLRYIYWYFRMNCIDAGSDQLLTNVLQKIGATGFDIDRFGLTGLG